MVLEAAKWKCKFFLVAVIVVMCDRERFDSWMSIRSFSHFFHDLFCVLLQMWWGGIHSELDAAIQDLLDAGHYLHFLDFGDDGSYFVSYD